jgi:hypothetical protein
VREARNPEHLVDPERVLVRVEPVHPSWRRGG